MRISDWSSDVCSSDLRLVVDQVGDVVLHRPAGAAGGGPPLLLGETGADLVERAPGEGEVVDRRGDGGAHAAGLYDPERGATRRRRPRRRTGSCRDGRRSEGEKSEIP